MEVSRIERKRMKTPSGQNAYKAVKNSKLWNRNTTHVVGVHEIRIIPDNRGAETRRLGKYLNSTPGRNGAHPVQTLDVLGTTHTRI
jgi:hypothetical protein